MKKNILFLTLALFITTGCSKTWSGIQQDSHDAFANTKEVIHDATAPDPVMQDVPQMKSIQKNVSSVEMAKEEVLKAKPVVETVKQNVMTTKSVAVEPVI